MEGALMRRGGARLTIAAVMCSAAAAGLLVWQTSGAAFSGTTVNNSNSWTAGTVSLTDDDSAGAMFSATGLKPGSTGTKCIVVTYGGSLASTVKLYTTASSYTGTLGTYVDLTIDEGTGGTFAGGCAGFSADGQVYSGTLSGFNSAKTTFANGIGTWGPTANAQTKVYRFTYSLQDNNAAQGLSGGIGFTWEAQNT